MDCDETLVPPFLPKLISISHAIWPYKIWPRSLKGIPLRTYDEFDPIPKRRYDETRHIHLQFDISTPESQRGADSSSCKDFDGEKT